MNSKVLLSLGIGVACAVIGLTALGGSTVAKASFDQVPHKRERLQVYGILDRPTIKPLKGATLVRFDLVEEKTGKRLEVLYDNPGSALPANFPAASHAQASGVYDPVSHRFVADAVMTKCPSKYDEGAKLDVGTETALAKWRKEAGIRAEGS